MEGRVLEPLREVVDPWSRVEDRSSKKSVAWTLEAHEQTDTHLVSPVHSCLKFSAVLIHGKSDKQRERVSSNRQSALSAQGPKAGEQDALWDDVREELNLDASCCGLSDLDIEEADGASHACGCVEGHCCWGKGRRLGFRRQTETKFDLLLHLELLGFLPVSPIRNSLSYLNTDSPLVPVTPAFIPRKNGQDGQPTPGPAVRTSPSTSLPPRQPAQITPLLDLGRMLQQRVCALREYGVRRLLSLLLTVDR